MIKRYELDEEVWSDTSGERHTNKEMKEYEMGDWVTYADHVSAMARASEVLRGSMVVLYVAGPFKGANGWEVERNIRRAETVALCVWMSGAVAICPHTMGRFYLGTATEETFLDGDLELLRRSDGVVVVEPWAHSKGTVRELELARGIGKPILGIWLPPDGSVPVTGLVDAFIARLVGKKKAIL